MSKGITSKADSFVFRQSILNQSEFAWIQSIIDTEADLGVSQIASRLCNRFNWVRPNGEYPVGACVVLLRRLESRGFIHLRKQAKNRPGGARHVEKDHAEILAALGTIPGILECQPSGPLTIRPIAEEERDGFRLHMQRYHYLGFERSVGESLCYAAFLGNELVALLEWGAAVLHCGPRDKYLGWDKRMRERQLALVVNNRRFLVLPWVRQPHLASRILAANLRCLNRDWQSTYGHSILLAETFVDTARFRGTCYRASNWIYVGETQGFSRLRTGFSRHNRPKAVFLYPLFRHAINNRFLHSNFNDRRTNEREPQEREQNDLD